MIKTLIRLARNRSSVSLRTQHNTVGFSAGRVTLRDLKRCRMAHVFFNTFFNLEKYLDNEQRDPFAVQKV